MKDYRSKMRWLALFLMLYLALGFSSLATPRQEIFPFYSWFLFAKTPGQAEKYALILISAKGELLAHETLFEEAGSLVRRAHSITAQRVIQNLGQAIEAKDAANILMYRNKLEERYLYPLTDYQVMRVRYNPLTRVRAIRGMASKQGSHADSNGFERAMLLGTYRFYGDS